MPLSVGMEETDQWLKKVTSVRKVIESKYLSSVFFAIANGVSSPTEIAKKIGKTKYTVSMHLSQLEKFGLIRETKEMPDDLRTKRYVVNWPVFATIFYRDHRLEFDLYENVLFLKGKSVPSEFNGKITRANLTITGDGKLGFMMHLGLGKDLRDKIFGSEEEVEKIINRILNEFIELLKVYVTIRAFPTIQQCLFTLYKELKDNCKQLKGQSGLLAFFDFIDGYFSKIHPFEEIWEEYIKRKSNDEKIYFKGFKSEKVIKQFLDAGWVDYTGRFVLDAEAQKFLKPGTKVVIYPSFTYRTLSLQKGNVVSKEKHGK